MFGGVMQPSSVRHLASMLRMQSPVPKQWCPSVANGVVPPRTSVSSGAVISVSASRRRRRVLFMAGTFAARVAVACLA